MSAFYEGQRLAILVDTANMYHSAKSKFQSRLDYSRLLNVVVRERLLVRAIAFVEYNEDSNITPFVDALRSVGFDTKVKMVRRNDDHKIRGGDWDVGIALHAARLAQKVDCIALVSGDGAFVELIQYLNHEGLRTEVYAFDGYLSHELKQRSDDWYLIDESWLRDR